MYSPASVREVLTIKLSETPYGTMNVILLAINKTYDR